ncbi:MAG TPA: chitinase, partial [Ktedonobacteraceae bacterium]|nr:chitinase [Ktedonobacteraceae bacterium]
KYYKLAFITANGCQAIWGTGDSTAQTSPVGQDSIRTNIDQLHKQGGDVAITFGGASGQELAQGCQDVPSLQKQYQNVIDTYQVKHLEFSIINAETTVDDRRNQALAALQKANPDLSITYTFPVTTAGLTQDKVQVLQNALKNGVKVDAVNIMAFDYGPPSGDMEVQIEQSAQATEKQFATIPMSPILGITPMIGMTDQHETFSLDDARKLRDFAHQHNYQLSMWTVGRDKACPAGTNPGGPASPTCSGVAQTPFEFIGIFNETTNLPPPPPPGGPSPTPPPGGPSPTPSPVVPPPPPWEFPCSDLPDGNGKGLKPDENVIKQDWLSGDAPVVTQDTTIPPGGRIFYTYSSDTEDLPQIQGLFGLMQVLGFSLMIPVILLVGYQFMLGASMFRYAGSLEGLSRVALGALAVGVSFELMHMLISLENTVTAGIIALHNAHPFPKVTIGNAPIPYMLTGEPASSYRGIVMPMSRWGCAINDFMGVVSAPFVTDTLGSVVPLIGGLAHLTGLATDMSDLIRRSGEMLLAILSCVLWVQVFLRIILLNYYILMAPLALGCWGLPGGIGQNVVRLWCKGCFTVLFVQVVQLFVLSTLPLLIPSLPQIANDPLNIMQGLLLQFPLILSLVVALLVPRILGASAAKAFGTAGSMAGGVIVAVGSVTASQVR